MNLSARAIFLVMISALLAISGSIQAQGLSQRHPHDFKRFNLGFLMGLNINAYNLKEQTNILDEGVLLDRVEMNNKPGLRLGMITNYNVSDQVSLRFIPDISLEERDFDFHFGDSVQVRKIAASYFNLPILLQYKTKYYRKYRYYFLFGANLGLNLASTRKVRDDKNLLKIKSQDFAIVLGTGMMLYGDRLKLSPEIRYSFGVSNLFVPENTTHAAAITKLLSQVVTICVNFE